MSSIKDKFASLKIAFVILSLMIFQSFAHASASEPATNSLENKVVVITGASSGFGKGVALKLAARGAHLVLAARRESLLKDLAVTCGNDAISVVTDVSRSSDVQHLADVAVSKFGRIDIWINDVGVGAIGKFEDIPIEEHSRLIDVNLKSVIYGSHIALKQFKKQKYGTLINIGSIESEIPIAYHASYAASKAGVLGLGKALNQEIRLSGSKKIKIVTVMPWAVDTPWWGHAANHSGGTARMGFMSDPNTTIDCIVRATLHPKKEMHAGTKAKAAHISHRFLPELTEEIAADTSHKYQIITAPRFADTPGDLFDAMPSGTGIDGGVRARMKIENKERKKTKAN